MIAQLTNSVLCFVGLRHPDNAASLARLKEAAGFQDRGTARCVDCNRKLHRHPLHVAPICGDCLEGRR